MRGGERATLSVAQRRSLQMRFQQLGIAGNNEQMVAEAHAFLLTATDDQVAFGTGLSRNTVSRIMRAIRAHPARREQNV